MKIILTALCFLACLGCNLNLESISDADTVFETTFEQPVPAGVSGLRTHGDTFSSTTCYLKFNASQKVLNALIGPTFAAVPNANQTQAWIADNTSGKTPPWWTPKPSSTAIISTSTAFHPTHFSGDAIVIYDTQTNLVFMYWNGWD